MTSAAGNIPDESHLLCEYCGYTLSGLPENGLCPECGREIAQSLPSVRKAPAWETDHPGVSAFFTTSLMVLFRPTQFYRTLITRTSVASARWFACAHWAIASVLLGTAAQQHAEWYRRSMMMNIGLGDVWDHWSVLPILVVLTFLTLFATTVIASRLTAWEAAYRGLRMPPAPVLRGMYFHAAHYLPVGLVALGTVAGYRWLLHQRLVTQASATTYLYVLCVEVLVGAAYLFKTYWIGMRNIMYANA